MSNGIDIFSFFAGAGFLDLGFEMSNFNIVQVNEISPSFLKAYKHARKELKIEEPKFGYHLGNVNDFVQDIKLKSKLCNLISESRQQNKLIGFIGGAPCPDFSIGGKNKGREGERGCLSATYIEMICTQKPDFFVFENVEGLWKTKKHRLFFDELKQKIHSNGYITTESLINSIEYGVPQDRNRIILVGFRKEIIQDMGINSATSELSSETFCWKINTLYSKQEVFSRSWIRVSPFEADSTFPCPTGIPKELTVEFWFKKNDVYNHPNSIHCFKPRQGIVRFETVAEGDDSRKSFKRLHRWRYSPTACYGNNEVHLHPYKARRISVAEALAIQSLPSGFVLSDNLTLSDMFKMIGNGVPYLAAKSIAKNIHDFLCR